MAEINLPVGIHTHNDAGVGVANTVLAVQAGRSGIYKGHSTATVNAAAMPISLLSSRRSNSNWGSTASARRDSAN